MHNLGFNINIPRSIHELQGRHSPGSISKLSAGSPLTLSQSPSYTAQHPGSATAISELYDLYQSPGSVEVSSDAVANSNGMDHLERIERKGESNGSSGLEFSQALRRLEEQLSLNDETLGEIDSFCNGNENSNDSESIINGQSGCAPSVDDLSTLLLQRQSGLSFGAQCSQKAFLLYAFLFSHLLYWQH